MTDINFKAIEEKWQKRWDDESVFVADDGSSKPKYYCLEMFPYPSGSGLHMGHAWNYTIGDIIARFKRLSGFEVLHPMGYDSLGLPAENAAIEAGEHPEDYTNKSIPNFIKQQKEIGLSYDWSRTFSSHDSTYYKWDQWIFLAMLEKGLAYQKKSAVNWCPKCDTVLANEQVVDGKCWRHDGTSVIVKHLTQWFLKITDYADELYENLDNMDWPERTKAMQKHWIGKSYGTEIDFSIEKSKSGAGSQEPEASYLLIEKSFDIDLEKELKKFGSFKIEEMDNDWGNFFRVNVSLGKEDNFIDFVKDNILEKNDDGGSWYVDSVGTTNRVIFRNKVIDVGTEDGLKEFFDYGKSLGMPEEQLDIKVNFEKWPVFTTRPDTIFGVTFVVVAAAHKKLWDLVTDEQKPKVEEFLKKVKSVSEKDMADMEKEGVFTGSYAINPANGERVPIYAGNFVVADYGSGMVMAVPAHDQRDYLFARKYDIPIKTVVNPVDFEIDDDRLTEAYTGKGVLMNSKEFDGIDSHEAIGKITEWLEEKGVGRKTLNFRLRDWGISRQRYWGTPIPIVHCEDCGAVPVLEKDLPVVLPRDVKFGEGNPLETNDEWLSVPCPKCGKQGRREAETMDTFANSSWYFLRYCDPNNNDEIFNKEKVKRWCPVDTYIGGAEHACMHLIYSRFYVKFLRDLGLIDFDEPAKKLFHQGMLSGEGGVKMSKSKPETCVLPEDISNKYGMDTARFFLSGLASPDKDIDWSEKGIIGSLRFIKRIFDFAEEFESKDDSEELIVKLNNTVKNVGEYYDDFQYRKATIELRELFDSMLKGCSKETYEKFLKLLNPICPHITEELWERNGGLGLISKSDWPKYDENKMKIEKKKIDLNDKTIEMIRPHVDKNECSKVYLYVIPFQISEFNSDIIGKALGKEVIIYSVRDVEKYDPSGKARKARPGMPSFYLE